MMKNFKKFTAFVLALCMLFSLSVAAFAAEADVHTVYDSALDEEIATQSETAASGTIPGSKIKWELNEHNWLSRGRLSGIRLRRSGLMIWTHCISLTLRTGLKTAPI